MGIMARRRAAVESAKARAEKVKAQTNPAPVEDAPKAKGKKKNAHGQSAAASS